MSCVHVRNPCKQQRGKYIGEVLGTFFLVLVIKMAAGLNSVFAVFAIGFGLMTLVYQFGWISGAHYNPAVTTAIVFRGNVNGFPSDNYRQIAMYIHCQLVGALLGGFASYFLGGNDACSFVPSIDTDTNSLSEAFFSEFFFTALLCSAVIHTGTHQNGNQFYGLAIGASLLVGAICIGSISGAVLNPAVWFGLLVPALACVDNTDSLQFEVRYFVNFDWHCSNPN